MADLLTAETSESGRSPNSSIVRDARPGEAPPAGRSDVVTVSAISSANAGAVSALNIRLVSEAARGDIGPPPPGSIGQGTTGTGIPPEMIFLRISSRRGG